MKIEGLVKLFYSYKPWENKVVKVVPGSFVEMNNFYNKQGIVEHIFSNYYVVG